MIIFLIDTIIISMVIKIVWIKTKSLEIIQTLSRIHLRIIRETLAVRKKSIDIIRNAIIIDIFFCIYFLCDFNFFSEGFIQ